MENVREMAGWGVMDGGRMAGLGEGGGWKRRRERRGRTKITCCKRDNHSLTTYLHVYFYLHQSPFPGSNILPLLLVIPLPIRLRRIFPILDNQILRPVIKPPTEVAVQDVLRALGIPLLRVQARPAHVRHHGVAAAERVLGVAERVVFGRGLREPDVAAVALEVAGFDRFGNVFFDDDGAAGGVYEPGAYVLRRVLVQCGRVEE